MYQEWEIINNTFVAMVMREGDKCGSQFRTVKVKRLNISTPRIEMGDSVMR